MVTNPRKNKRLQPRKRASLSRDIRRVLDVLAVVAEHDSSRAGLPRDVEERAKALETLRLCEEGRWQRIIERVGVSEWARGNDRPATEGDADSAERQ